MITDGKKWHYLIVRRLSALLNGITSKRNGDSYCLNCFRSYRTKESLEKHMKKCENKDYCYMEMPKKGEKLKYRPGVKSMKAPFAIYAESLLRKMDTCIDNPDKSSINKINKHGMCGKFTNCSFNEEYKHYIEKHCFICEKPFLKDDDDDDDDVDDDDDDDDDKHKKKNYDKVRDHCHYTGKYRGAAHKICNLPYNTPRQVPVIFHNGSNYDYHFIIKGLAEEFEADFQCLGESKEKCITFSVAIKKQFSEDETIIYRTKFIDSFRFMSTSLSNLAEIYQIE